MMPERRPLGELADVLDRYTKQLACEGWPKARLEHFREAATRLREFEGTVIEGCEIASVREIIRHRKIVAVELPIGTAASPIYGAPVILILKNPLEPKADE